MADKTQVNTSTDNAEKSNSEYLIQQVIDSSQASINKNKSNDVLLELVKDISNGNMDRATARLEAFEKLGKCNLLQLYEIPAQQGETLLHLAIRSQDNIEFVKKTINTVSGFTPYGKRAITRILRANSTTYGYYQRQQRSN